MKVRLKKINIVLLISLVGLLILSLSTMFWGKDQLSTDLLFGASVIFPFFIATKGIEFMIENQRLKVFVSMLLLSLVCILSLILIFI